MSQEKTKDKVTVSEVLGKLTKVALFVGAVVLGAEILGD